MLGITPWYVQVWELPRPLHRRGQVTVQLTVCWVHGDCRYTVDIVDIINYNYQVRGLDRDDDKPPGERGGEVETRRHHTWQQRPTASTSKFCRPGHFSSQGGQRQHVRCWSDWTLAVVTRQRDEPRCGPRDNYPLLLCSCHHTCPHLIKSSMMIDKQQNTRNPWFIVDSRKEKNTNVFIISLHRQCISQMTFYAII